MNELLYNILSELEEDIDFQKCWLNILKEHCECHESYYDSELMLIIERIEEFNLNAYRKIDNLYKFNL